MATVERLCWLPYRTISPVMCEGATSCGFEWFDCSFRFSRSRIVHGRKLMWKILFVCMEVGSPLAWLFGWFIKSS